MSGGGSTEFSPAALLLVNVLRPRTPFAEAIVRRQIERAGLEPGSVARVDLPRLVPLVVAASHAFVDPDVINELKLLA